MKKVFGFLVVLVLTGCVFSNKDNGVLTCEDSKMKVEYTYEDGKITKVKKTIYVKSEEDVQAGLNYYNKLYENDSNVIIESGTLSIITITTVTEKERENASLNKSKSELKNLLEKNEYKCK